MTELAISKAIRRSTGPTLRDVAEHAGVSPITVSRVINNVPNVRESTRRLVTDAIRAVGYSPNEAARRLATYEGPAAHARQIHIAMLCTSSSAYVANLLFGALEQARQYNAQFVVEKCAASSSWVTDIDRIVSEGADGFILAPPLADQPAVLEHLVMNGIPTVIVTSSPVRTDVCSVGIDAYRASKDITTHLLAIGHRRIGFISGHPAHATSEHRRQGYFDAMSDYGLSPDYNLVAQGDFTYLSGLDAAETLLELKPRPSAIFASNDDMAAAAVAVAHRLGIDVPADLSVVGFDDSDLATAISPQLTTIQVPVAELARSAADLLFKEILDDRSGKARLPERLLLDYKLVFRQSDAAPRTHPRHRHWSGVSGGQHDSSFNA